jgi:DNA-binding protein Fis
VLEQVEPPLLEATMEKAKYNQVRAAKILGVSRGTLRKKLKQYFDDKYCGTRGEE